MTRPILLAVAAGLLLAGCEGPDGSDRPARWSLEPVATITPEATGGDPFGRIADLAIGPGGAVFVLDGLDRTIRVFHPDGTETHAFGRRGAGPGELERPSGLLWGPEGNLWVVDPGIGRLTVFDRGGQLVATHALRGAPILFPLAVGFAGTNTLRWVGATSPDLSRPEAAFVESRFVDGGVQWTDPVALPFVEWPLVFEHRSGGMALAIPVPFSTEPFFAFDPAGRLWYTHSADTVVHRLTTSGEADLTIGRGLDPHPVTAEDRREALAGSAMDEVRAALGQAGIAAVGRLIPDHKPYLAGFSFGDDGDLWLIHAGGDAGGGLGRAIDIYDESGARIGRARARLEPDPRPRVRDGLLAAVVRDELGVESVALYRVQHR